MKNEFTNEPTTTTDTKEIEINSKGQNLTNDESTLINWRLLDREEKKRKYKLLEIGEFKNVILTRGEQRFVESNLPKRFRVSYDFNWGYLGCGPTDLALSILLHFSNQDLDFTHGYYPDLCDGLIQHLPQNVDVVISAKMLLEWVEYKRTQTPVEEVSYKPLPCEPNRVYDDNKYAIIRPIVIEEESLTEKKKRGKYVR
jgi:hypothetical protein